MLIGEDNKHHKQEQEQEQEQEQQHLHMLSVFGRACSNNTMTSRLDSHWRSGVPVGRGEPQRRRRRQQQHVEQHLQEQAVVI